jgi:uncharacterized protein (TIRG00374 family)
MSINRKKISQFSSILVTLVVFYFIGNWFLEQTDIDQVFSLVTKISLSKLLFLVISSIFNIWIFQYPYLVTTKGLKFWQAFQVRNTSFAISNCLPAGGTIGLTFQYSMLRSFKIGANETSATIGIASVWNGLISFFMPILGLISLLFVGNISPGIIRSTIIAVSILIIIVTLFILAFKSEPGAQFVGNVLNFMVKPFFKIFRREIFNISQSILNFRRQVIDLVASRWAAITFSNFMVQIGMFLVFFVCAKALHINISTFVIFAAFCFGRLGTTIPLTPGGVGTTDVIMASFLQLYGVPIDLSITAVLLWRFFYYFPQVLAGLLSFIYWQLNRSN